jgi:hypothetical protein
MVLSSLAKSETIPVIGEPKGEDTLELAIEHAKRAFALKKYEQAVDHYATALELMYVASIHPQFALNRVAYLTESLSIVARKEMAIIHQR